MLAQTPRYGLAWRSVAALSSKLGWRLGMIPKSAGCDFPASGSAMVFLRTELTSSREDNVVWNPSQVRVIVNYTRRTEEHSIRIKRPYSAGSPHHIPDFHLF